MMEWSMKEGCHLSASDERNHTVESCRQRRGKVTLQREGDNHSFYLDL